MRSVALLHLSLTCALSRLESCREVSLLIGGEEEPGLLGTDTDTDTALFLENENRPPRWYFFFFLDFFVASEPFES